MNEEFLINVTPQETRVAVLAAGQVQELVVEREASRGLVGNIYVGRVARVLPGMQSAFVEIGLERAAFLHVADMWEHRRAGALNSGQHRQPGAGNGGENGKAGGKPIEKMLAEGQPLTVQVLKDPLGSKGARASTQLSIAGRLLVYLPQDPHIGISQRIEDEAARAALREKLKKLIPADEGGGLKSRERIIKTHHGGNALGGQFGSNLGEHAFGKRGGDHGARAGDLGRIGIGLCRNDPCGGIISRFGWRIQDQHACIKTATQHG